MGHKMKESLIVRKHKEVAKNFIKKFFEDKEWFCGGPIPNSELSSKSAINVVIGTEFSNGIDTLYTILKDKNLLQNNNKDILFALKVLRDTKEKGIPKVFQAGMMLLYLKYCKGVVLPKLKFDEEHLHTYFAEGE